MIAPAIAPVPSSERRTALPIRTQAAMFLRLLAIQGSWSYEILLGNGIGFCIEPALRLLDGGIHTQAFHAALLANPEFTLAASRAQQARHAADAEEHTRDHN